MSLSSQSYRDDRHRPVHRSDKDLGANRTVEVRRAGEEASPFPGAFPGDVLWGSGLERHRLERLLEAAGVRALGLGERLEPVGDLLEALVARRLGVARVHRRVLERLAGD